MKSLIAMIVCLFLMGCARIDPFSPNLRNEIDNQQGKIDDIQNNQNGLLIELGKLKNDQQIMAEQIKSMQQGLINRYNENTGVQIFQGDGGLVVVFAVVVIIILVIYHYKTQADRSKKVADILAQEITYYNDLNLENQVFSAAINTDVEEDVYKLLVKHQKFSRH
jgi:predicted PurR-regulated permease PerM